MRVLYFKKLILPLYMSAALRASSCRSTMPSAGWTSVCRAFTSRTSVDPWSCPCLTMPAQCVTPWTHLCMLCFIMFKYVCVCVCLCICVYRLVRLALYHIKHMFLFQDDSMAVLEAWRDRLEARGVAVVVSGHKSARPMGGEGTPDSARDLVRRWGFSF